MVYGYARVSTRGQLSGNSLDEQESIIKSKYTDAEIVVEAYSGAKERPLFNELVEKCERGDVLVVTKLDRFCRSTKEGLEYIDRLMGKGVSIHVMNMGLREDTPMGRMIVTNLLAFAEFERAMIMERTTAGKEIARKRLGYVEGRPSKKDKNFFEMRRKVECGEMSVVSAVRELGICKKTWYNWLKETA